MARELRVTVKRFAPATPAEQKRGLLGYVTVKVHGVMEIDGISVRRTRRGFVRLSYPEHVDKHDIRHRVVWPSAEMRAAIERAVMQGLGLESGAP